MEVAPLQKENKTAHSISHRYNFCKSGHKKRRSVNTPNAPLSSFLDKATDDCLNQDYQRHKGKNDTEDKTCQAPVKQSHQANHEKQENTWSLIFPLRYHVIGISEPSPSSDSGLASSHFLNSAFNSARRFSSPLARVS